MEWSSLKCFIFLGWSRWSINLQSGWKTRCSGWNSIRWVQIYARGQLISKANCQAVNSSKKWTNEFIFTTMRRFFVCFLEEIEVTKKTFQNHLTFSKYSWRGIRNCKISIMLIHFKSGKVKSHLVEYLSGLPFLYCFHVKFW